MKASKTDYERLGHWNHTDLAYIQHDPTLLRFAAYEPQKKRFQDVISARSKFPVDRPLLLRRLKRQYEALGYTLPFEDNVILNENTFTVTTAHQPVLFTGPLYHIYKIASTINLARQLQKDYPDKNFIPVFVLGGEDHDWEEINHYFLFGKKHEWLRQASGSCGRLNLEGLDALIEEVKEIFKNSPFGQDLHRQLSQALEKATTYGQFHQALLISLFGSFGLVVFNMDDPDVKRAFIPILEKELTDQFSIRFVHPTQVELEAAGFKPQAYCRDINLFYLSEGLRERIDTTADGFIRVETKIEYTREELLTELHAHPERFSPNVIIRPLYQEFILPNIAFVGGGGEIAYWLERKSQFEAAGVHFPMLIRRNSALLIDEGTSGQIEKLDLRWTDFLDEYDAIVKAYLLKHSTYDLTFDKESQLIHAAYEALAKKAEHLDPTLATAILAEESKQSKTFEHLGSRLLRAEKQHQETNLKRIQKIKEKLFPEGGLQERRENFMSFYALYGQELLRELIQQCDPLDEKFMMVSFQPGSDQP